MMDFLIKHIPGIQVEPVDLPSTWTPTQEYFGGKGLEFKLDWTFPQAITLKNGQKVWFKNYFEMSDYIRKAFGYNA